MNLFSTPTDNETRYCFLTLERIGAALDNERVLDAVVAALKVPGKPAALKKLSSDEKLEAIMHQATHLVSTPHSVFHNQELLEVVAAAIWGSNISATMKREIWSGVRKEADLVSPVAYHLRDDGHDVFVEVPMGRYRIDVVGMKETGIWPWKRKVLHGVELKNNLKEFKRGLDQMVNFADYTHKIYLACTPYMGAEYLEHHAKARGVQHWDGNVLHNKLERAGIGLLLVEGDEVSTEIEAAETPVDDVKFAEFGNVLTDSMVVVFR